MQLGIDFGTSPVDKNLEKINIEHSLKLVSLISVVSYIINFTKALEGNESTCIFPYNKPTCMDLP